MPNILNRKKSIKLIEPQLTQFIYRALCLIYLEEYTKKEVSKEKLMMLYKIIIADIEDKSRFILQFSKYLNIDEINSILLNKKKFQMFHRNIKKIIEIIKNVQFIENSQIFQLFLA